MSVLTMCVIDERSDQVKDWLSTRDTKSVIDAFKTNYEGNLLVMPFEHQEVDVLRKIHRRTPCLGEIARILSDNFDEIVKQVVRH